MILQSFNAPISGSGSFFANDVAATDQAGIDDVSGVIFNYYNAAFARLPDVKGLRTGLTAAAQVE